MGRLFQAREDVSLEDQVLRPLRIEAHSFTQLQRSGAICVYIWMRLSRFALALGALWLALGFLYLCLLTRGFKKKVELEL